MLRGCKTMGIQRKGGRRGSVLMEFVVVAPLYFVLLGGLFIVADLMVNRIRMHIGDHLVTWVGGSRYCPAEGPDGESAADFLSGTVKTLFERSIGGPPGNDFSVMRETASGVDANAFMALNYGSVNALPVKMPSWARGMFAMQEATTGDALSEMATQDVVWYDCDYFRSFSYHRLALTGIDTGIDPADVYSRARDIPMAHTLLSGNLNDLLDDEWIALEKDDDGGTSTTSPGVDESGFPIRRALVQFGE